MKALLDTKTFQKIAPLLAERMPRKITKDLLLGSGDDIDFKSI